MYNIKNAIFEIESPTDSFGFLKEINNYFNGTLKKFQLKINPKGSVTQQKIWEGIKNIPYGSVVTYKELGQQLGIHPRIIGMGCRTNSIPIIIPCHRVVSSNPKMVHYSFIKGAETKNWLINHELNTK